MKRIILSLLFLSWITTGQAQNIFYWLRLTPTNTDYLTANGNMQYLLSTHKLKARINGVSENIATESWVTSAISAASIADGDKGDITVSGSGAAWTVDNAAITYAKIQNISAASRLLGRGDSGSGSAQEITLGTGLTMTGTTLSSAGGITNSASNTQLMISDGTNATGDAQLTWTSANDILNVNLIRIFSRGASGTANIFFGQSAGNTTVTGTLNVGLGGEVLDALTSGTANTGVGDDALTAVTDGFRNTGLGTDAGNGITSGDDNTVIGSSAGENITTGSNNLIIGANIDAQSATTDDQLSIQNIIFGTGNNGTNTTISTGKIGIGIVSPAEKLDVDGTVQGDKFKLSALNTAPANASDTGTTGEIRIDANHIYICVATNTWKRVAIATW